MYDMYVALPNKAASVLLKMAKSPHPKASGLSTATLLSAKAAATMNAATDKANRKTAERVPRQNIFSLTGGGGRNTGTCSLPLASCRIKNYRSTLQCAAAG